MKWFKHYSSFHTNPKGKQIIRKYGVEGAGFFWILCEIVAKDGHEYRLKSRTDWKISVQEISKFSQEKTEEILNFLGEIKSIDKKALLRGDLYIPKMAEYSDEYTDKKERLSGQGRENVGLDKIRIDKIRKEEKVIVVLKDWNERQPSPIQDFKPEHIVRKYGAEKILELIKQYGKVNGGFSQFIGSLNPS